MLVLRANEVSAKGAKISRNSATYCFRSYRPDELNLRPLPIPRRG